MAKTTVPINIDTRDNIETQEVYNAIKTLVSKVGNQNLIRLANKVQKDPGIIKTALKFI